MCRYGSMHLEYTVLSYGAVEGMGLESSWGAMYTMRDSSFRVGGVGNPVLAVLGSAVGIWAYVILGTGSRD